MTRFIQTVIYTGKKILHIDTKVPLYKDLKVKSSLPLAADPDFTYQDIKRVHLHSTILLHEKSLVRIFPHLD